MSNKDNKYLVQGSILAVASIISRFIGMLYRIPLTRIVGDDGMGDYGAAYEIYNLFLLLSSYSIPLAVSKLVSAREIKKEYHNSYNMFRTSMIISGIVGAIASAVLYFGASIWAGISKMPIERPLRVLAPTILVFAVMGVLRGLFQGKRTMIPTAISQLIEQIVNAIVSVAAAYFLMREHNASPEISSYGAAGGTMGTLFGAVFGLIFLLFIYKLYQPVMKKRVRKDTTDSRENFVDAARILGMTALPIIISQTAFQISGVIDTNIWGNVAASKGMTTDDIRAVYGIYSSKYRLLTNVPVAVATALGTAIVPTLAAAFAKENFDSVRSKVATSVKFNMLIAFPSAVGLTVLAKPIVILLFGYNGNVSLSAGLVRYGSIAVVLFALSTISNGILQGIDQMRLPVRHAAISLAVHVPLLYCLLKFFNLGAYGLVIGNITFALVICILNWRAVSKCLEYKQEIIKTFVLPFAASVIMGIVTYFSYSIVHRFINSNTVAVAISILISIVVYGIAVILLKTMDEEELLEMPKGRSLLRLCKKLHLM